VALTATLICLAGACGGKKVAPATGAGSMGASGSLSDRLSEGLDRLDRDDCVTECERRIAAAHAEMPGCASGLDFGTDCAVLKMQLSCSLTCDGFAQNRAFDDAGKNATGFDAPEGTAKDECPRVCGALALGWSMSCKGNEAKCGQAAMLEQQLGCTVRCQEAAGR